MSSIDVVVQDCDTGQSTTYSFSQPEVRIGRSPVNNLVLEFSYVSSYHALIQFDGVTGTICDLGSRNGTIVDSTRLERDVPFPITVTSVFHIGSLAIRVGPSGMVFAPVPGGNAQLGRAAGEGVGGGGQAIAGPANAGPGGFAPVYPSSVVAEFPSLMRGSSGASHAPESLPEPRIEFAKPGAPSRLPLLRTEPPPGAAGIGEPASWERPVDGAQVARAACLETFVKGFLEMRRGYQAFGQEMGLVPVGGNSPLHRAQDPAEILQYLLDPAANRHARMTELNEMFRAFMTHELALLAGVKAGLRDLLKELDPELSIEEMPKSRGLLSRDNKNFERYREHYERVTEDEGHSLLFGPGFRHAYARRIEEKS